MMNDIRIELDCKDETFSSREEMEILYVLSGRTAVMLRNTNYALRAEHFTVFNPYEEHGIYRGEGSHTLSFYIPDSVLREAGAGHIDCCSQTMPERGEYIELIRVRLAQLFKALQTDRNRSFVLSQAYGLLSILAQEFYTEKKPAVRDEHVINALRYIGSHYTQDISLGEVADEIHLSKSHLSRIFQKQTGTGFAGYVNALRLNLAKTLLENTKKSILDVALECGFSSANILNANFKNAYGCTPGAYRQRGDMEASPVVEASANRLPEEVSYMPLLKHAAAEENPLPLIKPRNDRLIMSVNVHENLGVFRSCHREVISAGRASELLTDDLRETIHRTKSEIDYQYVYIQGILDDAMDVYHESEEGDFYLNFTYIDLVVDFLICERVCPFIELGFTPAALYGGEITERELFGGSVFKLPKDLHRWQLVVESLLAHFLNRYGEESVKEWRFSPSPAIFTQFYQFPLEDYLPYYRSTYEGIRNILPDAYIAGCTLDTGLLTLDGTEALEQFLEYSKAYECMPDALSFQCMHADYSQVPIDTTVQRIIAKAETHPGEPTRISADSNILRKELQMVQKVVDRHCGSFQPDLMVTSWNSTHWHEDLGNDTCFKAAFVFKHFIENSDMLKALTYCHLTDAAEKKISGSCIFHGGTGLATYRVVPKAAYYAYRLLGYMDGIVVARRDGCLITRSADSKRICIGLYNYCHVDEERHASVFISSNEQYTGDRYYGFQDRGVRSCQIHLGGLIPGVYSKETRSINRMTGSSYDTWMTMGAPEIMMPPELENLIEASRPGYHFSKEKVERGKELLITEVLDAHEVKVVVLRKQ